MPDTDKPLKVSLAWTDAAAAVGANPALVNNLDLEVETGGQTYLGNVFSGGLSVSGGSADGLNNQENVYVASPGDSVTIRIIARNLPGDGIPGNGVMTDQDFALVCRNCVEQAGFSLSATPPDLAVCAPDAAVFDLAIGSILGYDEPVALSVTGAPAGTTAQFSSNPVVPPGTAQLQVGDTDAAAGGAYVLEIIGTTVDQSRSVERSLRIATGTPSLALPHSPANNATGIPFAPTLDWLGVGQADGYRVQLATEPAFASPLIDQDVTGTSLVLTSPLASSTDHYWRVQAANVCGEGEWSAIFRFRTQSEPGDCAVGSTPLSLFEEDFNGGLGGFTTTGSTGASTWALSTAQPGSPSGGNSVLAVNIATVSDQHLVSPPVALPVGQSPLSLQFWNHQHMESRTGGCWDGGLLEISADGGGTWSQVPDSVILNRAYDGPVGTGYSNPLAGSQAWCGDPRDWENYIVDLDGYAGQTVQFRWRLGTDSSVTRPGWHLDDVKVQACEGGAPPISEADLSVTMAAVPDPVPAGGSLIYLIQVGNAGPDSASGVQVRLELPPEAGFDGVAAGSPPWTCADSAGTVVCQLPGILPSDGFAPDLDIQVAVSSAASGVISAQAIVTGLVDDPDSENDQADVAVVVLDPSELIFSDGFECGSGVPGCSR